MANTCGPPLLQMKKKYPLPLALNVAKELLAYLDPVTERLEICGSVRRRRAEVSDLELLYIPRLEETREDFFRTSSLPATERAIQALLDRGILAKRPNVNGYFAWGPQNKLAVHATSGLPVDLFLTKPENWFVSLVIRTGPKELNLRLIEGAARRGLKLHAYGSGFTDRFGNTVHVTSEEDLFEKCGVPYLDPCDRKADVRPIQARVV